MQYAGVIQRGATAWLSALRAPPPPGTTRKVPSAEQIAVIEHNIARSLQEFDDVQRDADFRSEPLQLLLHGVPGAGKSQTLNGPGHSLKKYAISSMSASSSS